MIPARAHLCFGSATGFTVAGLIEALSSQAAIAWIAFGGSVVSTLAGLWISERKHADQREAIARDTRIADLLERLERRLEAS